MDRDWRRQARRNWQALAALLVFLVFAAAHAAAFRPVLARYQREAKRAVELGMPLDGRGAPSTTSPRVAALLAANSLSASVAEEQGTSGGLTAGLLDELTRLASKRGLEVLATEQGMVTQLPALVEVRARLKLRGRYDDFVGLLGDLGRDRSIITLDRFSIQEGSQPRQEIEVWASQLVLKLGGAR
jgi:Tfp pilus assembly protein PilO